MGTMCVGAKLSVGVGKADMDRVVALRSQNRTKLSDKHVSLKFFL